MTSRTRLAKIPSISGLSKDRLQTRIRGAGRGIQKKENQIFHGDGFEKNVEAVNKLEKELGTYDLAQFTPKI